MRRPHRSIETFDISLMAVVTKAMGAFLVLMLLLLPYYTPNKQTEEDLEEIILQLRKARDSIEQVSRQLGPDSGSGGNQAHLKEANTHVELAGQVVRKMRALLDKALADVARLEKENKRLADENDRLREELRQAEQEIAELKREIERLNKKLREGDRAVYVSVTSTDCHGVWLSGVILPRLEKLTYTWTKDDSPILPEHILFASYAGSGGDITRNIGKAGTFTDRADVRNHRSANNAIILADTDVGQTPHIVGIIKRSPKRNWSFRGSEHRMLVPSEKDCTVTFIATSKVGGDWSAMLGQTATISAKAAGAAILSIKSDEKGLSFAPVSEGDDRWFNEFVVKSQAAQQAWLKANPGKDTEGENKKPEKTAPREKQEQKKKDRKAP